MLPLVKRVWSPLLVAALLGGTALGQADWFRAAEYGSVDDVRAALAAGADLHARNVLGQTALMLAASWNENPEVAAVLLDAGADLEARDERDWTALMWAASRNENPEVVTVLLDRGADATATDSRGRRVIDYARENEHLEGTAAYGRLHDASFE